MESSALESQYMVQTSPIAARRSAVEERRRAAADFDHDDSFDDNEDEDEDEDEDGLDQEEQDEGGEDNDDNDDQDDEDGQGETTPLLPIFEAAHLGTESLLYNEHCLIGDDIDALPVYNLTHAIRMLVIPRCETTLTWDQLRSPQVSQFLVKPIQKQISTSHFSSATLYALMANCLQFNKEVHMNPGNSGTSNTRALVCELLAIKLLKEYSTRELVREPYSIVNISSTNSDGRLVDSIATSILVGTRMLIDHD